MGIKAINVPIDLAINVAIAVAVAPKRILNPLTLPLFSEGIIILIRSQSIP
jgi:hypothetical protein